MDRRTAVEVEFDHCYVGSSVGRGDVVQFYVGEADDSTDRPRRDMTAVGNVYQHDLDDDVLACLSVIEDSGELARPDTVLHPDDARKLVDDVDGDGA